MKNRTPRILMVTVATATLLLPALAAIGQDAPSDPSAVSAPAVKVPPSTNPGNHAIFPSEGQDADQQVQDQLAAYNWATEQTEWDPYEAYEVLVEKGYAAAQTAEEAQGGLVSGAARGALVGLAIGAIAGDAGKGAAIGATAGGVTGGMRSRRQREAAASAQDQAIAEFGSAFEVWDKNYVAAMTGHGYSVE